MSQASHLISRTIPGYGLSDSRRLPCSGVSGRAVTKSACLYSNVHRSHSQGKIVSSKFATAKASFICRADSRRNSNFPKRNRQGFSQSRNRQIGERDGSEFVEEYETPSPRKGLSLPLSGNPKFQATAVPGPREKEILELFRKVQVQLRERAAIKEEKKTEAGKGRSADTETVDSLIKLLRKHSVEHGKTNSSHDSSGVADNGRDFMLDEHKHNGSVLEEKSPPVSGSKSTVQQESQEMNTSVRLVSKFRRKSPIPQDNSTPNIPDVATANSLPDLNSDAHERVAVVAADVETEPELEGHQPKNDFSDELVFEEPGIVDFDEDNVEYIEDKKEQVETRDLTALKLTELRSLAKSCGVKGYSKMKKADLLGVLSGHSI